MGSRDCWSYLTSLGVHHRSWNDPLFAEGLAACAPLTKVPCIDIDEEDFLHTSVEPITCSAVGCSQTFTTVAEHAAHQRSCHQHMCSICQKSFFSHHLLDLHLLEMHDSLFQLMAEKKAMYQCLLETCPEKFKSPTERKSHCIDAHKFPSSFRFDPSWRKHQKKNSKTFKKPNKEASAMDYEVSSTDDQSSQEISLQDNETIDRNTEKKNIKRSTRIPSSLSFGSGVTRGFSRGSRGRFGRSRKSATHWHQRKPDSRSTRTNIEEVNMKDLEAALNDN